MSVGRHVSKGFLGEASTEISGRPRAVETASTRALICSRNSYGQRTHCVAPGGVAYCQGREEIDDSIEVDRLDKVRAVPTGSAILIILVRECWNTMPGNSRLTGRASRSSTIPAEIAAKTMTSTPLVSTRTAISKSLPSRHWLLDTPEFNTQFGREIPEIGTGPGGGGCTAREVPRMAPGLNGLSAFSSTSLSSK